jgi:hypothetical protein
LRDYIDPERVDILRKSKRVVGALIPVYVARIQTATTAGELKPVVINQRRRIINGKIAKKEMRLL